MLSRRLWIEILLLLPSLHLQLLLNLLKLHQQHLLLLKKLLQKKKTQTVVSRNGDSIRVRRGTTLSGIALRHQVSVRKLLAWNNLRHPKALRAGQWLRVKPPRQATDSTSGASTKPSGPRHKHKVIRVRRGDTLWSLARRYDTSVKTLLALNDLKSARHLQINQELIVPIAKKT